MAVSPIGRAQRRAEAKRAKRRWQQAHKASRAYSRNLVAVAKVVAQIVKSYAPAMMEEGGNWQYSLNQMLDALERYSKALEPWARSVGMLMLTEVDRREKQAWIEHGRSIGREIRREIEQAPTGQAYKIGMERQVELITSLPKNAAKRVHEVATGQLYSGLRGKDLFDEIMQTGYVTQSRAELIARTEVARATTELTRARAEHVGSPGYIWRTAEDADVRKMHKDLNDTFHTWDDPPVCDIGKGGTKIRAHAGQSFNCRCYPEPSIPDKYLEAA